MTDGPNRLAAKVSGTGSQFDVAYDAAVREGWER